LFKIKQWLGAAALPHPVRFFGNQAGLLADANGGENKDGL
jgi:hypothetical protein